MRETRPALDISSPLISVIMANYQAGPKIVRALETVLNQSVDNLEVIVSDDASGDDSVALVRQAMQDDPRIKLIEAHRNGGPAQSRNRALEMARGQWIAIVDADDLIHPERFERLLVAAHHFGADVVADDLLLFHEDGSSAGFLLDEAQQQPFRVTPQDWILAGIHPNTAPLGYLKPLIRTAALGSIRYDETLRIGEDYDLLLRLLLSGASLQVIPEPWYLYRRHDSSISHRLSAGDIGSMIDNQQRLIGCEGPFSASLQAAFDRRLRGLRRTHRYGRLVAAIKQRDIGAALALMARNPALALRLWQSLADRRRTRSAIASGKPAVAAGALHLGSTLSDEDPSAPSNRARRRVPPYTPPAATSWDIPSPRKIWAQLANLGHVRHLQVLCDDEAGIYAAGFIPAGRLEIVRTSACPHPWRTALPADAGALAK